MAKGKKYAKWYDKYFKEIEAKKDKPKEELSFNHRGFVNMPVEVVETGELIRGDGLKHPVHGYFLYECEKCGAVYQMYLDKGLEDKLQDKYNPDQHKPVPFIIRCRKCEEGMAKHILWGIGDRDEYEELPEGASYFKNDPKEKCGRPVVNEIFRDKAHWMRISAARRFGENYGRG